MRIISNIIFNEGSLVDALTAYVEALTSKSRGRIAQNELGRVIWGRRGRDLCALSLVQVRVFNVALVVQIVLGTRCGIAKKS